jgi:hypothetical protein
VRIAPDAVRGIGKDIDSKKVPKGRPRIAPDAVRGIGEGHRFEKSPEGTTENSPGRSPRDKKRRHSAKSPEGTTEIQLIRKYLLCDRVYFLKNRINSKTIIIY